MTTVLPRDLASEQSAKPGVLARVVGVFRSRAIWFVVERYSSTGFGFLLTAILTRSTRLDQLAEYLAAFALTSVFEPLFAASISSYLLRLIRQSENEEQASAAFRTVFWMMQGIAVLFVGVAFAACQLAPGDHLITALFFLQILFTPWKLFSAPLYARDEFMKVTPVQVCANLAGGFLRLGVALATHSLYLIPLLMCVEPIIAGPIFKHRSGVKLLGFPRFAPPVFASLVKQLPSLMGVMVLVCLFYRAPVMQARLDLGAADVVRVALAMQVITAVSVIQNALADSLVGPLAHAIDADDRFVKLLSIGSAVVLIYGLVVWAILAAIGEPLLTIAFGGHARLVGPIIAALAPLCTLIGLARLANTAINLRARPVTMVLVWAGALVGQTIGFVALAHWRSPIVIAIATPASLALGMALAMIPNSSRLFMTEAVFGFRRVLLTPSEWPEALAVMLGARSEAARSAAA